MSAEAQHNSSTFCPENSRAYLVTSDKFDLQVAPYPSPSVLNPQEASAILDNIDWKAFVYTCGSKSDLQNFTSFNASRFQTCCENGVAYFTNEISQVLSHSPQCVLSRCNEFELRNFFTNWMLLLAFGLVGVFGNLVVIRYKFKKLRKKTNQRKQIQIYNTLVLSLSFSDLLMGIYLTVLAVEIRHKVDKGIYFSEPGLCNALGVLNFLSSEVSLSMLAISFAYSFFVCSVLLILTKTSTLKSQWH